MTLPPVSLLLTTYEHGAYVGAALRSVLQQDYAGLLEIIVSDDASTDGTWEAIQAAAKDYAGPHRLHLRQNPSRMGETAHFGLLLRLASGTLIVNANGDDIHLPHRVRALAHAAQISGAAALSSNVLLTDAQAQEHRPWCPDTTSRFLSAEEIAMAGFSQQTLGATFAIHRKLLDAFGWFDPDEYAGAPDLVVPLRAALTHGFFFVAEPLLLWRQHSGQQTEKIASRSLEPHVFRALQDIHLTHGRVQCLRDLQRLRQRAPQHASTLAALEGVVQQKLLEELEWRCRVEAGMWAKGLRMRWG
jgi:hypothetical protein